MQQDNHEQRTFASKRICDCGEMCKLSDIDEQFAQVKSPDDVMDVQGNVQFASKVT